MIKKTASKSAVSCPRDWTSGSFETASTTQAQCVCVCSNLFVIDMFLAKLLH